MNTSRISLSISKKLLNDFDDTLKEKGYQNRSKGIRDALQEHIIQYQWIKEIKGDHVGVLTIYYDYHHTGVMEDLKEIQNRFKNHIKGIMQIYTQKNRCLDVLVMESNIDYIKDLMVKIQRLNGVEHVKLSISPLVDG